MPPAPSKVFSFRHTQHLRLTTIAVTSVDSLEESSTRVEGMDGGGRISRTRTRGSGFVRTSLPHLHTPCPTSADDCRRPLYRFLTTNTWGTTLSSITHIVFSQAGRLGCKLLKDLKTRLEDVEDDFDDTCIAFTIKVSFAKCSPPSPQW